VKQIRPSVRGLCDVAMDGDLRSCLHARVKQGGINSFRLNKGVVPRYTGAPVLICFCRGRGETRAHGVEDERYARGPANVKITGRVAKVGRHTSRLRYELTPTESWEGKEDEKAPEMAPQ